MKTIAVVGLGYVGLPLAVEFGKKYRTLGVDLSPEKIASYKQHCDPTGEVSSADLKAATMLTCSTDPKIIAEADYAISGQVAVSGDVLRAGKKLKLLHKWGVGYDNIDVGYARSKGIVVTNTPDVLSDATAEIAILCMLGQ